MIYNIKSIPTTYGGVRFRSRLEARWAAFFDLAKVKWDYEPFDLEGWAPDFMLRTPVCSILVEVKPVDAANFDGNYEPFQKAFDYWSQHQVLLLGISPIEKRDLIGIILDPPNDANHGWTDVMDALMVADINALWREAGNIVQWQRDHTKGKASKMDRHVYDRSDGQVGIMQMMRRGVDRRKAIQGCSA